MMRQGQSSLFATRMNENSDFLDLLTYITDVLLMHPRCKRGRLEVYFYLFGCVFILQ